MSSTRPLGALAVVLVLASCAETPTSVLLRIEAGAGLAVPDELRLSVYSDAGREVDDSRVPSCAGCKPELPDDLALFPSQDEGELRLLVRALAQGKRVGEGIRRVALVSGQQVAATLTISPGALADGDGDGVPDEIDSCRTFPNPEQRGCPSADGGLDARPDGPRPDLAPKPDLAPPPDTTPPDQSVVAPGNWVLVKPGTFTMGSPASESCRDSDETPHKVTLTRAFRIMDTPVTRAMFVAQRGYTPTGNTCGATCPVVQISWHEAAAYCDALSKKNNLPSCYACTGNGSAVICAAAGAYSGAKVYACPGFRLPTEAEWEYACRAATTTPLYNGAITNCTGSDANGDKIGWHNGNSAGALQPVAKKAANAWGLHDMAGNTYDWIHDRFQTSLGTAAVTDPVVTSGTNAVRRGGAYTLDVRYLRSANRSNYPLTSRYPIVGVRCVRTAAGP